MGGIDGPNKLGKPTRYPTNCTILVNWVFENFILAYEPFAKVLRSLETSVSVNNSLCGKLVLSWELIGVFWYVIGI